MPSVTRSVEVRLAEAILLADLYEIASDLKAASEWCARAIELAAQETRDWLLEEALVTAAVVKYGRCFTKGVRLSLKDDDIASLRDDLRRGHDYFIALRHKFVAHAVNAFEETFVTVGAREKDGERFPASSINPGSHRLMLSAEMAVELAKVVAAVTAIIATRVQVEEARLLAFIQSLPIEVVHGWDLHSPTLVGNEKVQESRLRGVNAQRTIK
jgi:hypothetical protein